MRYRVRGHVLRDRKAWETGLEERDVAGTDLPRDIARDTKLGVGVAVQAYIMTWSIIISGWPSLANRI